RQIDALQLHVGRHLQRVWRKVQDGLDAGAHDQVDDVLRRRGRHGDDGDADAVAAGYFFQIANIEDGDARARLLPDLGREGVEQRANLEAFLSEPGVVRQGKAEVACADDRHPQLAIEPEDLAEVPFEVANVVTDAADAELAEIRQILPDL